MDIPAPEGDHPQELAYDPEWLAIIKNTYPFLSLEHRAVPWPAPNNQGVRFDFRPTAEELRWVTERVTTVHGSAGFVIPQNFTATAAPWSGKGHFNRNAQQPNFVPNPQTKALLDLLELKDVMAAKWAPRQAQGAQPLQPAAPASATIASSSSSSSPAIPTTNPDEIDLGDDIDESVDAPKPASTESAASIPVPTSASAPASGRNASTSAAAAANPDEIDLGDDM